MSILLSAELEVDGNLKVTGTIEGTIKNDSLAQVIANLQAQINALQTQVAHMECINNGIIPEGYCDCFGNVIDVCGVCGGGAISEDECINYALSFNGNGDYVDFDNPDILNFNHENDFTICLWFKTNSALPSFSLFDKRVSPSPQTGIHIFFNNGQIGVQLNDRSINHDFRDFGSDYIDNLWHYLVLTVNSETNLFNIYVDNENLGTVDISDVDDFSSTASWKLGYHIGSSYFSGHIDNFVLLDAALTQSEIQYYSEIQSYFSTQPTGVESSIVGYWNFNEGSDNILNDLSGNGNHGTIHGATWVER